MKTNIFSYFNSLGIKSLNLTIDYIDNEKVVSIVQIKSKNNDEAIKSLPPIRIINTIENLDENFLQSIEKPIKGTLNLIKSVEDYDKILEEQAKKSKEAKDKADKIKADAKKVKDNISKAKEILNAKEFDKTNTKEVNKIKKHLNDAIAIDATNKDALKTLDELKAKLSENSLF